MTVKRQIMALIEELPEEATLDEIEYHLYVRRKIERSKEASERGEVITHEEMKARVGQWLQQ